MLLLSHYREREHAPLPTLFSSHGCHRPPFLAPFVASGSGFKQEKKEGTYSTVVSELGWSGVLFFLLFLLFSQVESADSGEPATSTCHIFLVCYSNPARFVAMDRSWNKLSIASNFASFGSQSSEISMFLCCWSLSPRPATRRQGS